MRMNSIAVGMAAVAGLVCVVVVVLVAGNVYAPLGDSDPGLVTTMAAAGVRFLATGAGVVTTGALAFAAFVVPRAAKHGEALTADAFAAVRTAAVAAPVWIAAAAAMVPLSAAESTGQPLGAVLPALPVVIDAAEEPKAWLCVLAVAVIVAVGTRVTLAWPPLVLW
ncbi:cytochrome c oxidase assembly protein, partial [Amycolatopsis sp. NPDC059657]